MKRCRYCFTEYDEALAAGVCPVCGHYEGEAAKNPRSLPVGHVIKDRYVVGDVIGDGGFGITYLVWDREMNVALAMKEYYQRGVVNRVPGTAEVFVAAPGRAREFNYGKQRLLEEARIVSRFQSSAIVRVNDYCEANGTTYMIMEYLDSPTLTEYMLQRNQVFSPEEVRSIALQLCDALEEMHAAGVLHRDIAPDNIFIDEAGRIKLIDFGSARLSADDTLEDLILVKEGFSPVEQYESLKGNQDRQREWTDIYALGATLYYCATGVKPTESRVRKSNVDKGEPDIREPSELNPAIPENLNNTIMRAMAINSHERFRSASEMRAALQGDRPVLSLKTMRRRKRTRRSAGIVAAIVIAAGVTVFSASYAKHQAEEIELEPASISLWYRVPEGDAGGREQAIQAILDREQESLQFRRITVASRGIPEDDYEEALEEAWRGGTMPTLFECVDETAPYMAAECITDVSDILKHLDGQTRSGLFLEKNRQMFQEKGCVPTGFAVPVAYVNPLAVKDYTDGGNVGSAAEMLSLDGGEIGYKGIAVDPLAEPLFRASFADYDRAMRDVELSDRDEFLEGNAALYLSLSSSYRSISDTVPTLFTLSGSKTACMFQDFWSISTCTENELAAAEELLSFFYTSFAQEQLYLSAGFSDALPLNREALLTFANTYPKLSTVANADSRYTFDWYPLAAQTKG